MTQFGPMRVRHRNCLSCLVKRHFARLRAIKSKYRVPKSHTEKVCLRVTLTQRDTESSDGKKLRPENLVQATKSSHA